MKTLDATTVPLEGTTLIEASAGTGKTFTITTLVLRLVVEAGLPLGEILVVTYTRAATGELRQRIRRRLVEALAELEGNADDGDPALAELVRRWEALGLASSARTRLEDAVRGFDEAAISTIHGFCQRTLSESAFESGAPFETELVASTTPIVEEVAHDFWTRTTFDAPAGIVRALGSPTAALKAFVRLAERVVASPDMPVLPESAAPLDRKLLADVRRAAARLHAIWRRDRAEIVAYLGSPAMNANSYRPAKIANVWAPFLDALESWDLVALVDGFERLTLPGRKLRKSGVPAHDDFFQAAGALAEVHERLGAALDEHRLATQLELVGYARSEVPRRKRARGVQGFDDLLLTLRDALKGPGGEALARRVRSTYRAALIDEFQDTDPVQCAIFERIYHGTGAPLFLIGDPKQAIYAFRGADVFAYFGAVALAGERIYTLGTNYRSDPRMVGAVNHLFGDAAHPFLFDSIAMTDVRAAREARLGGSAATGPALEILFVAREGDGEGAASSKPIPKGWGNAEVPDRIASEIVRLLASDTRVDGEPIAPHHVAVLCRQTRQARAVQEALVRRGVPAVLEGEASVFRQPVAEHLGRVLAAVAEPGDARRVRVALVTPLFGLDAEAIAALAEDDAAWDARVADFRSYLATWQQHGFVQAFRRMIDEQEIEERLLARTGGERHLTDLLHLGELLHAEATERHRGPVSLLHWFETARTGAAATAEGHREEAQVRLESDARAVQLTTIHKSKGLEYPVVYCPFVWDGALLHEEDERQVRFHDPRREDRLVLDLGSEEHDAHVALARREALAESLRLLYVALTRAQHRCTVVWGRFNESETSALGYLAHQPPDRDAQPVETAAATRIRTASDAELLADLAALATRSEGAVAARALSADAPPAYRPRAEATPALASRTAVRRLSGAFRTSSFSNLTAAEPERVSLPEEEGLDHDAGPLPAEGFVAKEAGSTPAATTVRLAEFPAGPGPGQLVHTIYEHIDFRRGDPDELPRVVETTLARHGVGAEWRGPLTEAIADTLRTPLGDEGAPLCLGELARGDRLDEMEFLLPVARGAEGPAAELLTVARLARVLEKHGAPAPDPAYVRRLGALGFPPLSGYLKGFIDLVFTHGDRFFVVDYKSNRLGATADDYLPERLVEVMAHHHYYLQYLLYTVALHRFLGVRLSGYDYDRHFGGVLYLFVRGMAPSHPPGTGIFRDRPSRALVEELAELFAPRGGTR